MGDCEMQGRRAQHICCVDNSITGKQQLQRGDLAVCCSTMQRGSPPLCLSMNGTWVGDQQLAHLCRSILCCKVEARQTPVISVDIRLRLKRFLAFGITWFCGSNPLQEDISAVCISHYKFEALVESSMIYTAIPLDWS